MQYIAFSLKLGNEYSYDYIFENKAVELLDEVTLGNSSWDVSCILQIDQNCRLTDRTLSKNGKEKMHNFCIRR